MPTASNKTQNHRQEHRPRGMVWPLILILVGTLLLLQNFGLLPMNVWDLLWRFWPVVLVLVGMEIIVGYSLASRILTFLLTLAVAGVILLSLLAPSGVGFLPEGARQFFDGRWQTASQVRRGREELREHLLVSSSQFTGVSSRLLDLKFGGAQVTLKDEELEDYLVLDSLIYAPMEETALVSNMENGQLTLRVRNDRNWNFRPGRNPVRYDLTLGRTLLPTSLKLDLGAGTADINLSKTVLRDVLVNTGAGTANVSLTGNALPTEPLTLGVGAGTINLSIPGNVGILVRYNIGVGTLTVDGRRFNGDGQYRSPNYDAAPVKLTINADVGAGTFNINR